MSTVAVPIDVLSGRPDVTNTPETVYIAGTNFPADGIAFTSAGSKALYLKIGAELYGNSGNWTLDLHWYSRSGSTSGNVNWIVAMAAITPGDAVSVEAKAFATSQNVTTTVNATAKGETLTSITISNLDGVNAGDTVWIKITRGTDTMTGDAILIRGSASYQDASTGTAGSGDFVGPASATATAVVLFNSTTGKLGMNSVVLIDGSGNMTGVATVNTVTVDKWAIVNELATAQTPASTTLANITGMSIALPRAGTYWVEGMIMCTATAALTSAFGLNVSANFTRMNVGWTNVLTTTTQITGPQAASLAVGGTGVASGSRSVLTALPVFFSGSVTVSGAATLQLMASRSTSTLTINTGSAWNVREQ